MSLLINPYRVMREEAEETSAENFGDSQQVKDVIEDLADAMENIPAISGEPVESNGQPVDTEDLKVTAEMVNLIRHESTAIGGGTRIKYLLEYSVLRHFMEENEIEDPEEAVEQIAAANSDTAVVTPEDESKEPEMVDVDIDAADVVVIAPKAEDVKELVANAQQEAAHGFYGVAVRELAVLTKHLSNPNVNWRHF